MRVLPAVPLRLGCFCLAGLMAFGGTSARAQQGTLRGTVTDSTGAPIANADIGIVALRRLTRTDDKGQFELAKLPPGDIELGVRRLSFEPRTIRVVIGAARVDSLLIVLIAHAAVLDAMNVNAGEVRRREMVEDFYRRRTRGGGGQFITRDQIEKRWGGAPSDLLRSTPGIRFVRVAGGGKGVRFPNTSIARRDCAPMIWIDGQKAPGMEIDDITLHDIEGVELYHGPSTTPLQFSQSQSSNTCGTIVIWSRPPQYQAFTRKP